ncbi:MAG TPA: iron ABC transporter permease [Thermotogaceae bacterium]|nr:iron ABC transporter permease [Thermotogaceae bacterium]
MFFNLSLLIFLILIIPFSLNIGSYKLSLTDVWNAIFYHSGAAGMIVWNIRLPRILTSIFVGAALAVSGAIMQTLLKNPLASPFTMGTSHGAMFGASLAILLFFGSEESSGRIFVNDPYSVVIFAFIGAIAGVLVILTLARLKGLSPEAVILAGVAISSVFTAGTTLIHYFADELQLASMVYWSFGDLGRTSWKELILIMILFIPSMAYFVFKGWDLNAAETGDNTAKSLGIEIERLRFTGILLASLITAVSVAFVGIIGFVGLICPHIIRLMIGSDHRFLIPSSAILGALLLLGSDMISRVIVAPTIIPVGIITSFIGVPLFMYLLLRMEARK